MANDPGISSGRDQRLATRLQLVVHTLAIVGPVRLDALDRALLLLQQIGHRLGVGHPGSLTIAARISCVFGSMARWSSIQVRRFD